MLVDEVTQMRADAQAVLDALAAERLPDHAAVRDVHDRVLQLAHMLSREAEDPITIGVVGEFSVGKSMLLGTLLGQPALLPVEERATTGNITALYLHPGRPGEPTRTDGSATVHFMSETELAGCVAFMCDELIAKASASKFPPDATTLRGYNPVTDGWERLEDWCRRFLWPPGGGAGSLEPRQIAAELLAVRDAHLSAPGVCGGQVPAGEAVVKAALDLRPSEITPDSFPARILRPGLTLDRLGYDETALAKVFPLIRRVSYRVLVNPDCWSMDSLSGGNAIVILDFPGLASGRSDTRDKFLSRNELEHVHTIITVFNSARSDTEVPRQFFTMLESHGRRPEQLRDYIIAIGNAFDLIAPPDFPSGGPLTLEDLRAESQLFRSLWVATSNLTQRRENRIRAVSSVAAIARYRYSYAGFGPEQAAHLDEVGEGVAARQRRWGQIGARLAAGEPASPWGATLSAFGDDGGISSLRMLIESHVAEHGLRNKVDVLRTKREQLVSALTQLEALLPSEQIRGDETAAARLQVDQLCDQFRRKISRIIESVNHFRDPMRLTHAGTGVIESAREHCLAEVMSWAEWGNLVQRADNGLIPKSVASTGRPARNPFLEFEDPEDTSDDTTEIFFERYCKSFGEVVTAARESLKAAVAEWITKRNADLAELKVRLADQELLDLLAAGRKQLAAEGRRDSDRTAQLRLLADLSWAAPALADVVREAAVTDKDIASRFPLPRPRYLPWHRAVPEQAGDLGQSLVRHQMYVFRMRREIATAMADGVAFQLADDIASFHRDLVSALETGVRRIPDPGTVRRMFPDVPEEEQDGGEGAAGTAGSPVRSLLREWRASDA